jgi:hypothetical protein
MASEQEDMRHASECVRLVGLTDDMAVRDQLVETRSKLVIRRTARSTRGASDHPLSTTIIARLRTPGHSRHQGSRR